uniref:Uncharacterized protein n=1 Tax=Xiphophorus couchianus TaxID=32473 RepID=A0A3B5M624_9TELE
MCAFPTLSHTRARTPAPPPHTHTHTHTVELQLMNCPPTKRLKGLNQDVVTAVASDDPFGDDEEFTQDDLDEIDIIASQAFTSAPLSSKCLKYITVCTETSHFKLNC